MDKVSKANARQEVSRAWQRVHAAMRHLDPSVTVKPSTFGDIFVIDDDTTDGVRFEIKPVVLSVPQKIATNKSSVRLFVVINGNIKFELEKNKDQFVTSSFGTNIGYFRIAEDKIEHVYGAHFDFDPSLVAHPVFHSQLKSHADLFEEIQKHHSNFVDRDLGEDCMRGVLVNVRLPTAQMDFFGVLLQVCSDHLINDTSGKPEKAKRSHYENLRRYCSFFRSYGATHTGLQASIEARCYRSPYWYDHPPAT